MALATLNEHPASTPDTFVVAMSEWLESPASTPPDTTLFAVGDIHGRLDLLCALQRLILERANESDTTTQCIVYLGDYIDKGPDSLGVLHHLNHRLGNERIQERYLLGNHDQYLLQTLQQGDPAVLATWFDYGGRATLERLGVPWHPRHANDPAPFQRRLHEALGSDVVGFLERLELFCQLGDYLFVHAGLDPSKPLIEQDFADFLLIREPFLSWPVHWPHPFCVVHGHTPARPTLRPHRIGIDTGAFYTDALTAIQLQERKVRFLTVSARADIEDSEWLSSLPKTKWAVHQHVHALETRRCTDRR